MGAFETITQYGRMLENLDAWLQKAIAYGQEKGFDPEVLTAARLAPDQYSLVQQVQSACDAAKFAAAYLSGQKAPSHPDTEKTIPELRARLKTTIDYLATFKKEDFNGAEERQVRHNYFPEGKHCRGGDYLDHLALPNFHFHVTTAYAILRHNGIDLGKMDYIPEIPWK